MKDRVFYSREDVSLAEWVLQTSETLNQGLITILWALKVIYWYMEFRATCHYYLIKYPTLTHQQIVDKVSYKIRNGYLSIGEILT